MGNLKKSILFKICVISILIILSTMGIVNQSLASTKVHYKSTGFGDNPPATASGNRKLTGYEDLRDNTGILCCQEGTELDSDAAQENRMEYDVKVGEILTPDKYNALDNPTKTQYKYTPSNSITASFSQAYILSQTDYETAVGEHGSEYARNTQKAWWALNGYMSFVSGGSAKLGVLGSAIEDSSLPYSIYTDNISSMRMLGISPEKSSNFPNQKARENIKNLLKPEALDILKNYDFENRNINFDDVIGAIIANEKFQNLNDDNQKRLVLKYIYTYKLREDVYDDFEIKGKLDKEIEELIKLTEYESDAKLAKEVQKYENFINSNTTDNGKKLTNDPYIDKSKAKVEYEADTQCLVIGPFVANYPQNQDINNGKDFLSGITSDSISVAGFSGNIYEDLKYVEPNKIPTSNQYTYRVNFGTQYQNKTYPMTGTDFYVVLGFNDDYKSLASINFTYEWAYFSGEYKLWAGNWKALEWEEIYYYEEYYQYKDEKGIWSDPEYTRLVDGLNGQPKEKETKNTYTYYIQSDKIQAYRLKAVVEDSIYPTQMLAVNLGAEVEWYKQPFGVALDIEREVTIKKIVSGTDEVRTFYFNIYEDNELLYSGVEVPTNGTVTKSVTPYQVNGKLKTISVREVDQYGVFREDFDEKGINAYNGDQYKYEHSLWNKYEPVEDLKTSNEANTTFVFKNNKKKAHSHLKVLKKFNKEQLTPGTKYEFELDIEIMANTPADVLTSWATLNKEILSFTVNKDKDEYKLDGLNKDFKVTQTESEIIISYEKKIEHDEDETIQYRIKEYDNKGREYSEENVEEAIREAEEILNSGEEDPVLSIWALGFKPDEENAQGTLKVCTKNDKNLDNIVYTIGSIKNNIKPREISVEGLKTTDFGNHKSYNFDILLYKVTNNEIKDEDITDDNLELFDKTVLTITANTGIAETSKPFKVYDYNSNSRYIVRVVEQEASDGSVWKELINNTEGWEERRNSEGNIGYIQKEITLDSATRTLKFEAENEEGGKPKYTGLKVRKDMKISEGEVPQYPDAFYFVVGRAIVGGYEDEAKIFFPDDILKDEKGKEIIAKNVFSGMGSDYNVVKIPRSEDNQYYLESRIAKWHENSKEYKNLSIIEVDQFGDTYSENPREGSIWENWEPENKKAISHSLPLYSSQEEAENSIKEDASLVIIENGSRPQKHAKLEIKKDFFGDEDIDKYGDVEFTANVFIESQDGTKNLRVDNDSVSKTFNKEIKFSYNVPKELDVTWYGENPKYIISEVKPDNFIVKGYKVNDGELKDSFEIRELLPDNKSNSDVNTVVIVNEEIKEAKIQVLKNIVDQNGNPTTSDVDQKFYFDVYVAGKDVEYDGETNVAPEDIKDLKKTLTRLEVVVEAGCSQASATTNPIKFKGDSLKYIVVETDDKNVSYDEFLVNKKESSNYISEETTKYIPKGFKVSNVSAGKAYASEKEYDNSLWNKYKPGKVNKHGIWTGTLLKDEKLAISIDADNVDIDNYKIPLNLNKLIMISDKLVNIEGGQRFYFELKLSNGEKESIVIDSNEPWTKTIDIKRSEIIEYTLTEYDCEHECKWDYETYTGKNETEIKEHYAEIDELDGKHKNAIHVWESYKPADGKGIQKGKIYLEEKDEKIILVVEKQDGEKIEKEIEDSTNLSIELTGINNGIIGEKFSFTKKISGKNGKDEEIQPGEEFYFTVRKGNDELDSDELLKLFPDLTNAEIKTLNNSDRYAVIVHYDEISKKATVINSKQIAVTEIDDYEITEVDQYGDTTAKHEDSIWYKYEVTNGGSWKPTKDQLVHEFINKRISIINVQKQVDGMWDEDKKYDFELYAKNTVTGEFDIVWKGTLTKDKPNSGNIPLGPEYVDDTREDKFIIAKLKELNGKVEKATINTVDYTMDTDVSLNYEKGKINKFVFNVTNNEIPTKGHIKITKKFTEPLKENKTVVFDYKYIKNGEPVIQGTVSIDFNAGEQQKTIDFPDIKEIKWDANEENPKFEVTERDGNFEFVSISSDAKDSKTNGHTVTGTVEEDTARTVEVTAINTDTIPKHGHLKVYKDFIVDKNKFEELQKASGNQEIEFCLAINNVDKVLQYIDGKLIEYNPTDNKVEIRTKKLISQLNEKGNDIFGAITVKWSGNADPTYTVEENCTGNFWKQIGMIYEYFDGKYTKSGSNTIQKCNAKSCDDGKSIGSNYSIATIKNSTIGFRLCMQLGGTVWRDGLEQQKRMNANGIMESTEIGLAGVYVQPERILVDKNGKEISRKTNAVYQFSKSTDKAWTMTKDTGNWKFLEVLAPAIVEEDCIDGKTPLQMAQDGYRIKYDVKFYYDGVKYSPTKYLAEASGDNIKQKTTYYMSTRDANLEDNSHAIETLETRKDYNTRHEKVSGNDDINYNEDTGYYECTGYIGGTEIKYQQNSSKGVKDPTDLQKFGSKSIDGETKIQLEGSIDRSDVTEKNYQEKYMMATTGNAGLKYLFKDYNVFDTESMKVFIKDADRRNTFGGEITSDGIVYKYEAIYNYATNINLGLVEREQTDLSMSKTVEGVTIIINDKATYIPILIEDDLSNVKLNINTDLIADEIFKYTMATKDTEFNIYESEYFYRTEMYKGTEVGNALTVFYNAIYGHDGEYIDNMIKSKELQIYITYAITMYNNSPYEVKVHSFEDYSESSMTYVDVATGYKADIIGEGNDQPGLWAYVEQDEQEAIGLTNIFANNAKFYEQSFKSSSIKADGTYTGKNKSIIKLKDEYIAPASKTKHYMTYRVDSYDVYTDNELILGVKENIAEIASFTAYYTEGYKVAEQEITEKLIPAAVFDRDSAPSNYNIVDYPNVSDDDTDKAQIDIRCDDTPIEVRNIKGTAWMDEKLEDKAQGNGIIDNKESKIAGLTVDLVEVIDLPVRYSGDDLIYTGANANAEYTEFEYYMSTDTTETNSNGDYEFNQYYSVKNGVGIPVSGLVPANYIVRFSYGDKEIYDDDIMINGEDYKTTIYKVKNDNGNKDENGLVNNEWVGALENDGSDNEARDNEARRLQIIQKTQTLTNDNTTVFNIAQYKNSEDYANAKWEELKKIYGTAAPEKDIASGFGYKNKDEALNVFADDYNTYKSKLIGDTSRGPNGSRAYAGLINNDGYKMFADTAKMNMKIANGTNAVVKNNDKFTLTKYEFNDINIGLIRRPDTNIELDKQIKEITLSDASGKTFFHIDYDIEYATNEKDSKYYQVSNGLYVKIEPNESSLIGVDNLQAVNDEFKKGSITQGFRYINIDSNKLQGVTLNIKYQIAAINLSEEDYYGTELYSIMYNGDDSTTIEKKIKNAIKDLSSSEYTLDSADETTGTLHFEPLGYIPGPKNYGRYVGRSYYTGDNQDKDELVRTTVKQVVDYIDNDISFIEQDNSNDGELWTKITAKELQDLKYVDSKILRKDEILDNKENPYLTIVCSSDSAEFNGNFVKELVPITKSDKDNTYIATTYISESKTYASTDKGDTGIDNLLEIIVLENNVGSRDREVVHGNYNPRGGAITTTERDSSATELVTLSPPTGLDRGKAIAIEVVAASLVGAIVLAGGIIIIKKKVL